jgi:hypothetical protein
LDKRSLSDGDGLLYGAEHLESASEGANGTELEFVPNGKVHATFGQPYDANLFSIVYDFDLTWTKI